MEIGYECRHHADNRPIDGNSRLFVFRGDEVEEVVKEEEEEAWDGEEKLGRRKRWPGH